jgi:hypothetical protein
MLKHGPTAVDRQHIVHIRQPIVRHDDAHPATSPNCRAANVVSTVRRQCRLYPSPMTSLPRTRFHWQQEAIREGSVTNAAGRRRLARASASASLAMRAWNTNIRTAALSVRTRWRPGPWCGSRRPVRSISANSLPIVVWRSIVISRNCSQNSGSTVIDVSRPLILTWCRQGDWNRFTTHSRIAHAA